MTADCEYLVSYGQAGDFARFRSPGDLSCARGDQVVVKSTRGLEVGRILCPVVEGHTPFLSRTALGELVRPLSVDDEQRLVELRGHGQALCQEATALAAEMGLQLLIVDAEILLDEKQAVLYHLSQAFEERDRFVQELARRHGVTVTLENLALPAEEEEAGGCGKPGCGSAEAGGCSSCGSGGGCSTCGKGTRSEDVAALLAGYEPPVTRTPLL